MATKKSVYKHVVLASDLSEHSQFVANRAAAVAKASGAKLSIVHVLTHANVAYAGEFTIPLDIEFDHALKKQAANQLTKLAKKHNVPAKSLHLLEGSVKLAITDFAKKVKADLIVVGTHSHTGLEILLGSQANAILHAASCDVLVVRIKK